MSSPLDFRVSFLSASGIDETGMEQMIKDSMLAAGLRNPGQHLRSRLRCRPEDVYTEIREWKPHLLHIYSHMASWTTPLAPDEREVQNVQLGRDDGWIALMSDPFQGKVTKMLTGEELLDSVEFAHQQNPLKCVLLTGCNSARLARMLLTLGIPLVVGTESLVTAEDCRVFCERFYWDILREAHVRQAYDAALSNYQLLFREHKHKARFKIYPDDPHSVEIYFGFSEAPAPRPTPTLHSSGHVPASVDQASATLRAALRDKRLFIVLGAGVTLHALSGSPHQTDYTWAGVVRHGLNWCKRVHANDRKIQSQCARFNEQLAHANTKGITDAADYIRRKLDETQRQECWNALFSRADTRITSRELLDIVHNLRRRGARLITTNYDTLVESTDPGSQQLTPLHQRNVEEVNRWYFANWAVDSDTEHPDARVVYHIHGHWQDCRHMVLDNPGYDLIRQEEHLNALLDATLIKDTVLFLGCGIATGLQDSHIGPLLAKRQRIRPESTQHVLVMEDLSLVSSCHQDATVKAIRSTFVQTLHFGDKWSMLPSFVHGLFADRPAPTTGPQIHCDWQLQEQPLTKPTGVAVDPLGHVFIAEQTQNGDGHIYVYHFDDRGRLLHVWCDKTARPATLHERIAITARWVLGRNNTTLKYVVRIAVTERVVYVTDYHLGRILAYDRSRQNNGSTPPAPPETWNTPVMVPASSAICASTVTGRLYVSTGFDNMMGLSSAHHGVLVLNQCGDVIDRTLFERGRGARGGQFHSPCAVALYHVPKSEAPVEYLYVVDDDNNRVQKFDTATNRLCCTWDGSEENRCGRFDRPWGVAVCSISRTVYVVDTGNKMIKAFDLDGNYKDYWKIASFRTPCGIAVCPQSGRVYVLDAGFDATAPVSRKFVVFPGMVKSVN